MSRSIRTAPTTGATVRAYIGLPHPWAVLIVMLATALLGLLATGGRPDPLRYALLLATMLGGQIAIGALNEYCDRDLDAAGNVAKPIPAGLVSPRAALGITAGGLIVMLAAGALLGALPLLLAVIGTGMGLIYDLWLKPTPWSGLPYLIALPLLPIWVWVSLDRMDPRLLLLYPIGALMVIAIHLAQSLPDTESDDAAGAQGLAARLGHRHALWGSWGSAALTSVEVAIAGAVLGTRPAAAIAAAAAVLGLLAITLALHHRAPDTVERHLFKVMSSGAVILGLGWVIALGT